MNAVLQPMADSVNPEQAKYEQCWSDKRYRIHAPGEGVAMTFVRVVRPQADEWCIDFGTGTGRGALQVAVRGGLRMWMLDFAANCLDEAVAECIERSPDRFRFTQHDLMNPLGHLTATYGYCTDVMEHIPPDDVDKVLKNILSSARHVFLHIHCTPDDYGKVIVGEPLHLTVQPYAWWKERIEAADGYIRWSQDDGHSCSFYVSRYASGKDVKAHSTINTSGEDIMQNIRDNLKRGLPELRPHEAQDTEVMVLAGGPSLNDFEDEIIRKRAEGMPLITTNGAYNWCLARGMNPGAQVILDARPFNKRFVWPVVPGCRYLLASQVHPDLLDAVPPDQVLLWHTGTHIQDVIDEMDKKDIEGREWYIVPGGMTVMLRTLPLLIMLGYSRFHIYGWDSCLMDGAHHAYRQDENNSGKAATVTVTGSGRKFACHGGMVTQAQEFIEIQQMIADKCQMKVYGDGLIAHIIETGASLAQIKEN